LKGWASKYLLHYNVMYMLLNIIIWQISSKQGKMKKIIAEIPFQQKNKIKNKNKNKIIYKFI